MLGRDIESYVYDMVMEKKTEDAGQGPKVAILTICAGCRDNVLNL